MEYVHQDGGGADAVHVVISPDEDGFPLCDGFPQQGDGFLHPLQQEGIMEILRGGGKEALRLFRGVDSPGAEQGGKPVGIRSQGGDGGGAAGSIEAIHKEIHIIH